MNNQNQYFPDYVESDLNKSKLVKPPRIKSKETDIYIYETNKTILEVVGADNALAIQVVFSKAIKFQSTVPLNGDIAKPKFADPSDSAIWGGQLNGIIFEELDLNSSNYNFFTFGLINQDQLSAAIKYRITSYEPVYDNKNNFLYANLIAVQDSIKTIKAIQKFNWSLTQAFQADVKTKYISIDFDYKSCVYSDGINITILAEKNGRPRDAGFQVALSPDDIALKLIKIRQTLPLLTDDITYASIQSWGGFTLGFSPIFYLVRAQSGKITDAEIDQLQTLIFVRDANTGIAENIDTSNLLDSGGNVAISPIRDTPFFSFPWEYIRERGLFRERTLLPRSLTEFLNGSFRINNIPILSKDPFVITTAVKVISREDDTFEILNTNNEDDRLYFVLTNKSDLRKYFDAQISTTSTDIVVKSAGFKNRNLTLSEWGTNFIGNPANGGSGIFTIDLELQTPGFNPKIDYEISHGEFIQITQYDENHNIIGIPKLRFQTENVFNDSKKKGSIQL